MLSPKGWQVEICVQKIIRTFVEKNLLDHNEMLNCIDSEHENRCRKTLTVLREARLMNDEYRRLKDENGKLVAKHALLQRQCAEATEELQTLREQDAELQQSLSRRDLDLKRQIREYEDTMQEIAKQFREAATSYNDEAINAKIEEAKEIISELEKEEDKCQQKIAELMATFEGLKADVPEDILSIVGQNDLEQKLNYLMAECEQLGQKAE